MVKLAMIYLPVISFFIEKVQSYFVATFSIFLVRAKSLALHSSPNLLFPIAK